MRKIILFSLFILMSMTSLNAQFKAILSSNSFNDSLSRIINDARHNYFSIQGVSLSNETDRDSYQSVITLPGSLKCMIYRYHSIEDTLASWHALMYKGENFEEAAKIYKNTFRSVKKSSLLVNNKKVVFKGEMDEPDSILRFTVSTLKTSIQDIVYNNFIAETEMINTYDGWEVHLNLQRRKDDKNRY